MGALYKGFWTATVLAVPAIYRRAAWYALGGDLDQTDHDDRRRRASRRSTWSGPASSAWP